MATKVNKVKGLPVVYAFALYGGVITKGYSYVKVSNDHPETIEFEKYKQYYGENVKGRFVKCVKSLDDVKQGVYEKLQEQLIERVEKAKKSVDDAKKIAEEKNTNYVEKVTKKMSDSDFEYIGDYEFICNLNVTDVIKILKEVTEAKNVSTIGVFDNKSTGGGKTDTPVELEEQEVAVDDEVVVTPPAKVPVKVPAKTTSVVKTVVKTAVTPAVNSTAKNTVVVKSNTKNNVKQTVVQQLDEVEAEQEETEEIEETEETEIEEEIIIQPVVKNTPKPVKPKVVAKPPTKSVVKTAPKQVVASDEEIVVNTKNTKPQPKKGSITQIVLDEEDDEEQALTN